MTDETKLIDVLDACWTKSLTRANMGRSRSFQLARRDLLDSDKSRTATMSLNVRARMVNEDGFENDEFFVRKNQHWLDHGRDNVLQGYFPSRRKQGPNVILLNFAE